MASPLDILNAQAAGINTARAQASPVQNVMIQQNPLTCYSECSVPATPASALLQPNLGNTCDTFQICVTNTSTDSIVLVLGGARLFAETSDPSIVFTSLVEITGGLTPANATAAAQDCSPGIASGQKANVPATRFFNDLTGSIAIASRGVVGRFRTTSDSIDNVDQQLATPFTSFELDPWNGKFVDVCTRTNEAAVCGPCVNGSGSNNVTTYNEACLNYFDALHGISIEILPKISATFQMCYAGIADVYNYRSCSTPSFTVNAPAAY